MRSLSFNLNILVKVFTACFVINTQSCFSSIMWFCICSKYFVQTFPTRLQLSVSTVWNLWKIFFTLLERFKFQRLTLKPIVKRRVMESLIFLIRAGYLNLARIVCYFVMKRWSICRIKLCVSIIFWTLLPKFYTTLWYSLHKLACERACRFN